jgi:flagellar biosynthesis component FlhA
MKDNQGKIDDFLAELELKHMQGSEGASHLNPAFSSRLDAFAKSIFEDSTLTKNFTTELRYGMGSALGCKLVEMLWDDLSPSLGDTPPSDPKPELRVYLPEQLLAQIKQNWNKTAVNFTRESGVLLPAVEFHECEESVVYFRALELGTLPEEPHVDPGKALLGILKENAWRFLTFDQVSDRLRELWSQKPKLYRASREERVPLRTYVFVLRHLLKGGVPIVDLDIIVDSLFLNLGLDDLSVIADNVIAETEELICGKQEPVPRKRSAQELSIAEEVSLELGHRLAPYIDTDHSPNLVVTINRGRRLMAREHGWVMPTVNLRVNKELEGGAFRLSVRGVEVFSCDLDPRLLFVSGSRASLSEIEGPVFNEPAYGVAKWIDESLREQAEQAGLVVVDMLTFMTVLVTESVLSHSHRLFTSEAFDEMLDALNSSNPALMRHFREESALRSVAKKVFYNLLKERVPIVDKNTILESIVHFRFETKSPFYLTELIRYELRGILCKQLFMKGSRLEAIQLEESFEQYLEEKSTTTVDRAFLTFGKKETRQLLELFENALKEIGEQRNFVAIVTTPALRPMLRYFLERRIPRVVVLSEIEIEEHVEIDFKMTLKYSPPDQSVQRIW